MKKRISILILLFILLLSFCPISNSEIVTTTDEDNPISTTVQKTSFLWNGRVYVWYSNGVNMAYKHRSKGTGWSSEIEIRVCDDGHKFSLWLEEDGINGYVHYVVSDRTEYVYYRKGKLNVDGSMPSWVASEQGILIGTPNSYNFYSEDVGIAVDSDGYPIVVVCTEFYYNEAPFGWQTQVFINANKDGIWSTVEEKGIEHPTDGRFPGLQIVPQTNRMFWVWASDVVNGANHAKVYHWDGSSWSGPTGYEGAYIGINNWSQYNMLCESGSNITRAFYNRKSNGDYILESMVWDGTDWSGYTTHARFPLITTVNVVANLDTSNNHVRVTWLEYPDANKIYYMTWNGTEFTNWNGATWDDASVWITETDDIIEHEDFNSICSASNFFGITYITNASSKNIEFLHFPEIPPIYSSISIIIYEDEAILGSSLKPIRIDGKLYGTNQTIQLIEGQHSLSFWSNKHDFVNWTISFDESESYFGNKTVKDQNTTTTFDHKLAAYGTSYILDRQANITTIWAYLWSDTGTSKGRCGIYKINGLDIENAVLMGETQELTGIDTTGMWRNFTFTGGLLLEADSYAIIIHCGDETGSLRGKMWASTGSHMKGMVDDTYSDGLTDIFGTGGDYIPDACIAAYAEYTYDVLYVDNNTKENTILNVYGDGTLTLYMVKIPDLVNLYTWIALLLAALFLMIWSPAWFAWKVKKVGITSDSIERLGYAMLLFLVGFGLLIMCIYM